MTKTIGIFTTSRADFGIFSSFLRAMQKTDDIAYCLFVGGAHLSNEYGRTINEIRESGFTITSTFDYLLNEDTAASLARSAGIEMMHLADIFRAFEFDFACVLGDRFELIPIVLNAILFKKPIIHLSGGEITEGVIDDQIRHMVTKAAHVHFVSCEEYARNVEKMGEPRWRIFNTGELSIDNLANTKPLSKEELFGELSLDPGKDTAILTYHPVTLEYSVSPREQVQNIFDALKDHDLQLVITAPNTEVDREIILDHIRDQVEKHASYRYIESLGALRFQSLLRYSKFIIGNSSSGIVEAPFLKIPSINIGDRQKGRLRHPSVIDTGYEADTINRGIRSALNHDFVKGLENMVFQFGSGSASERMIEAIRNIVIDQKFMRKSLIFPSWT
ncbi:MAG: UDP-N-acetylglucosamine 2-epimerase [Syntrophorhabdaceae bacterium]